MLETVFETHRHGRVRVARLGRPERIHDLHLPGRAGGVLGHRRSEIADGGREESW